MNLNIKTLFKNTFFLYILVFSTYFFSFITVPYQTRILGPDYYGRVGFALAFMTYFRMIIDFGFLLSATEEVAKYREDKEELSRIVTAVSIIKLILVLVSFLLITSIILIFPRFREEALLYIITFFAVATSAFLPDYLYRGLENMKTITIRTVLIQSFFVLMIFLFLNEKEDYYLIPLFTMIGNLVAIIGIYAHAIKVIGIRFKPVKRNYLWYTFKRSSFFFYSRIATTIYTATNTFLVGLVYPKGSSAVGLYTSSEKLISTAKSGFSPIADSLYPYMVKNRDFKLVKKILLIIIPPVLIGVIIIGIYAESFISLLLGEEFRQAGGILRILLPIIVITPITYILGFPVLTPMGLSKHANMSIIYASIFHIIGMAFLLITDNFNVYSTSYITVVSEIIIMGYRAIVIWRNRITFKKV